MLLVACGNSKKASVANAVSVHEQAVPNNTITVQNLQGTFTCNNLTEHRYAPGIAADAYSYYTSYRYNCWVRNDTLWKFEYPCKYLGRHRFEIKNGDSIYFDNNSIAYGKIERNASSDVFIIKQKHLEINPKNLKVTEEYTPVEYSPELWSRDSLDFNILEKLKHDSLNYNYLEGDLELVTYYNQGYGEEYTVDFPLPLPKYFSITSADSARLIIEKKRIYLPVYGKPRLFNITSFAWNENEGDFRSYSDPNSDPRFDVWPRVLLVPGKWWTGLDFTVEYGGTDSLKNRKEIVPSQKNAWIELPAFKQVKNSTIEKLATVMESLGYIADPSLLRQYQDYGEYLHAVPIKSGKFCYYKIPVDSQRLVRTRFLTEEIEVYNPNNVKGVKGDKYFKKVVRVFDTVNFSPLKRVKNFSSYFFRNKQKIKASYTDYECGMAEIWEFGSEKEAQLALAFLDKYLIEYSRLANISYGGGVDYKRKGKILYVLYSISNLFEEDYFLKKALEKIIISQ